MAARIRPRNRSAGALPTLAIGAFLAGLCTQTSPCQTTPSHSDTNTVGQRVYLSPQEFETALGKALAYEVEHSSKLVDDAEVLDYLNRLAAKIASDSHVTSPISIRVIDSSLINTITLPGGLHYVNRGLILQIESEAELAGVMARCIANTTLRAQGKKSTNDEMISLRTIPQLILGPGGSAGPGLFDPPSPLFAETDVKARRHAEVAADYLGLQYLYEAGHDPEAMQTFLERVWPLTVAGMNAGLKSAPYTFSPYPPLQHRLKAMRSEIKKTLPVRGNLEVSSSEYEAIMDRLRAWRPARTDAPAEGKPTLRGRAAHNESETPN